MDDAPATKRDLIELEQRFDAKLDEKLEAMETKLLKAFYDVAETWSKRFADIDRSQIGVRERVLTLEDRVLAIEKRLNMPPGTAA